MKRSNKVMGRVGMIAFLRKKNVSLRLLSSAWIYFHWVTFLQSDGCLVPASPQEKGLGGSLPPFCSVFEIEWVRHCGQIGRANETRWCNKSRPMGRLFKARLQARPLMGATLQNFFLIGDIWMGKHPPALLSVYKWPKNS